MDTYPSESRPLLRINLAAVSFFFFFLKITVRQYQIYL